VSVFFCSSNEERFTTEKHQDSLCGYMSSSCVSQSVRVTTLLSIVGMLVVAQLPRRAEQNYLNEKVSCIFYNEEPIMYCNSLRLVRIWLVFSISLSSHSLTLS